MLLVTHCKLQLSAKYSARNACSKLGFFESQRGKEKSIVLARIHTGAETPIRAVDGIRQQHQLLAVGCVSLIGTYLLLRLEGLPESSGTPTSISGIATSTLPGAIVIMPESSMTSIAPASHASESSVPNSVASTPTIPASSITPTAMPMPPFTSNPPPSPSSISTFLTTGPRHPSTAMSPNATTALTSMTNGTRSWTVSSNTSQKPQFQLTS